MYESFSSNKLQDNAESSDTFINRAVLTVASYTRTVYYKYNRIPVFYHLPFASWKQIQKWVYLNIMFSYVSLIVFLSICLYIFGDSSKMILPLAFCIALWDIYYMHLFFQDMEDEVNRIVDFMEDDFNRIVDSIIIFWVSFQISFLNFINVLHMFLDNLPWRQLNRLNGFIIWNLIVSTFISSKHVNHLSML